MKTLLLMRHSKSSWDDQSISDHDRPLNHRGKKDAKMMGYILNYERIFPSLIICSSAKRAYSTAKKLTKNLEYNNKIILEPTLYDSNPLAYIEVLRKIDNSHNIILVVGHNPILENLVEMFTGSVEIMPTSSIIQIELLIENWDQLSKNSYGKIINIWSPKISSVNSSFDSFTS